MKNKKYFLLLLLFIVSAFLFLYVTLKNEDEKKLIKEGNKLVKSIEAFKYKNNRLPSTLDEIGIAEKEGLNVLYYSKRDSTHFTISFPVSAEQHKFYYSDSKCWEVGYREMK